MAEMRPKLLVSINGSYVRFLAFTTKSGLTDFPPISDNEFRCGFLCADLLRIAYIIRSRADAQKIATRELESYLASNK